MFTVVGDPKIKVKVNKMRIDLPISKHIPSPLPGNADDPRSFAMALVGVAGSGKSSLLNSMLSANGKHSRCYYKRFHHCYFIVPKSSLRSLPKSHPMRSHPDHKVYDDLTLDSLEEIAELVEANAENGERSCLVMDDIGSRLKQNRALEKYFTFLLQTRRHLQLNFFICLQTFNDLSLSSRKNLSHCCLFKSTNRKEQISVWTELLPVNSKEEADELFKFVYDVPYSWLYVKLYTGQMYKRFQLIEKKDVGTN